MSDSEREATSTWVAKSENEKEKGVYQIPRMKKYNFAYWQQYCLDGGYRCGGLIEESLFNNIEDLNIAIFKYALENKLS